MHHGQKRGSGSSEKRRKTHKLSENRGKCVKMKGKRSFQNYRGKCKKFLKIEE